MGVIILVLFFFLFMLKMEKLLQLRSPGAKLYCEDIMPCYVINCLVFLYYSYNIFVKLSLSKFDSLSFCLFSPLTLFKFGFMAIDNFCFFRSKCNFLNVFSCYFNLISNVWYANITISFSFYNYSIISFFYNNYFIIECFYYLSFYTNKRYFYNLISSTKFWLLVVYKWFV